jgi:hypothetical protein
MAAIDRLDNGTRSGQRIARHLKHVLTRDPESFWEVLFLLTGCGNPITVQADRLLRSGAINEQTTFDELPGILAVDEMEEAYRRLRTRESNYSQGVYE